MKRPAILVSALVLAGLLASLHFAAISFYFYWTYWWYDVIMHFLAGITLGLAAYWVFFESGIFFKKASRPGLAILLVFLCVFAVGIGWEIFEYTNGITDSHEGYAHDTTNDLILDACGATLAAMIGTRKKRNG